MQLPLRHSVQAERWSPRALSELQKWVRLVPKCVDLTPKATRRINRIISVKNPDQKHFMRDTPGNGTFGLHVGGECNDVSQRRGPPCWKQDGPESSFLAG